MPRLPDAFSQQSNLPTPSRGLVNVQPAPVSDAAVRVSSMVTKMAEEEANRISDAAAQDAMNKLREKRLELTYGQDKGFTNIKGGAVIERPITDEYPQMFQKEIDGIGASLQGQASKDKFNAQAKSELMSYKGDVYRHVADQTDKFYTDTFNSTVAVGVKEASASPDMVVGALDRTSQAVDKEILRRGLTDKNEIAVFKQQYLGAIHAAAIDGMLAKNQSQAASVYLDMHKKEMSQGQIDKLEKVVKSQNDWDIADEIGTKASSMTPTEAQDYIQKETKGNKEAYANAQHIYAQRMKAIDESKAINVSGVWKQVDSGISMKEIQRSPAWQALDDTERHKLKKQMENDLSISLNKELLIMQRDEKLHYMQNGDKFLTVSDPDVLSKMSRAKVEALRGEFGMEATNHLLTKWDALQKPGKIGEARFDKEDFDQVADNLGLKPYAKNLSEDQKRALGTLKYRIEQMIDIKQQEIKRPLARQEKMDLMRQEMSRTVTVNPGIFSYNKTMPVVQLTKDQMTKVIVPDEERSKIVEALKEMYSQYPDNPSFAPTEDNVRRLYVRKVSPAGGVSFAQ